MRHARLRTTLTLGGGLLAWMAGTAAAAEPERLSSFQPLTIQDAYPTRFGQVQLEAAFRWDRTRESNDLFEPRPQIKFGVFPGLQLSVGVPYRLGDAGSTDQGDVEVGALYQLSDARGAVLPALAIEGGVLFPLGPREGTETNLALLATRPLTERGTAGPALHLNVAWRHMADGSPTEREDRYVAAVGYSHPVSQSTTLLVDFVREEERRRGREANLIEVGVRQRVAENLVLSAGIGFGIGDESPSTRIIVGVQHSFRLF